MLLCYDKIYLNETKIDDLTKLPILNHSYYNVKSRDRNNNGGGILFSIRKESKLELTLTSSDYELLSFQLTIRAGYLSK